MQERRRSSTPPLWLFTSLGGILFLVLSWNVVSHFHATQRPAPPTAHPNVAIPKRPEVAVPKSPVVPVNQLIGTGRIYLVQMGPHDSSYALNDFAGWIRSKYALDVQILPQMALDRSAWNSRRRQYVAELLYDQIKREHPDLAADSNAYLFGFTDADMYSVYLNWSFSFSQRDSKRAAMISSARLRDNSWELKDETEEIGKEHLQARLRRVLLKDIAVLYWHLPLSNDPNSLLHRILDPDLPSEDIYLSDLHPERTRWGRSEGEPCIFFVYSSKDGIRPLPGALIRSCDEDESVRQDEGSEIFEFDLRLGLLIDKHTDFYLPGSIPIEFRRATRDGWTVPMAFGFSGTHNYDKYLASRDMRRISIIHEDGGRAELDREPSWLPVLSLVKYVDAAGTHSGDLLELRWHSTPYGHFDLKQYNGEVETYLPCDDRVYCFLTGYHNAQGEALVFDRDNRRRLTRLTSPNQTWLRLSYDEAGRIFQIDDSRTRTVQYGYDNLGRLASVQYPSGEILHYEYDTTRHLLTFAVSPNGQADPTIMLHNEYEDGRLVKQIFGGRTYTYSYLPKGGKQIAVVTVRTPENQTFDVEIDGDESTVREVSIDATTQENVSRSDTHAENSGVHKSY